MAAILAAILDHLDKVSVFGPSAVALFLILGLDWVFTGVHTYQEWRGEAAPLWRVFEIGRASCRERVCLAV